MATPIKLIRALQVQETLCSKGRLERYSYTNYIIYSGIVPCFENQPIKLTLIAFPTSGPWKVFLLHFNTDLQAIRGGRFDEDHLEDFYKDCPNYQEIPEDLLVEFNLLPEGSRTKAV